MNATRVPRLADEYWHLHETPGGQVVRTPATPAEYHALGQPGAGPPTPPPGQGPPVWLCSQQLAAYETPTGQLRPGDVCVEGAVIRVVLESGEEVVLDAAAYTLAPDDTLTPDPPGFTLVAGVLSTTG